MRSAEVSSMETPRRPEERASSTPRVREYRPRWRVSHRDGRRRRPCKRRDFHRRRAAKAKWHRPPGENALRECRRVQRRIRRRVVPPVGNVRGSGRAIFGKHDPVSLPLPNGRTSVPNHLVGIFPAGKVPSDTPSPSPLSAVLRQRASLFQEETTTRRSPQRVL